VEFDHADIYADLEAVKLAFKRLVNLVPRRGVIVAYDGSENVTGMRRRRFAAWSATAFPRSRTGASKTFAMRAARAFGRFIATAQVWAELEMQVAGEHNALNATAAAALAANHGVPVVGDSGGAGQLSERQAAA
jgi:UDP-N-acetylmuramate: L-alanyl-gamma-D-glutamyl-meso-diaminopimelate ligase